MPTPSISLTPAAARALHLAAQGLLSTPRRRARKADVLAAIARMQLLQIDTIHVVARSPYLVLYSRLGAYPPSWLDESLAEAAIFETWAHEACFAPMSDWPLLRRHLHDKGRHWAIRIAEHAQAQQRTGMQKLLEQVREHGPVRSADFVRTQGKGGGWWGWKDEKRWLEAWFALGELMVLRRDNFQRVYELSERVLARAGITAGSTVLPDSASARQALIERSVRALGIARIDWLADYFRLGKRVGEAELAPLLVSGVIEQVSVRGWSLPAYVHRDLRGDLLLAAAGRLRPRLTTLLSPFDPVIWHRERALALFDFDYRLECYTPAPKRRYGYFVLPILHRGRLVGRLDAKAHRGDGVFEVKALELQEHEAPTDSLVVAIAAAIAACARWHGASRVSYGRVRPGAFMVPLRRATRGLMTG